MNILGLNFRHTSSGNIQLAELPRVAPRETFEYAKQLSDRKSVTSSYCKMYHDTVIHSEHVAFSISSFLINFWIFVSHKFCLHGVSYTALLEKRSSQSAVSYNELSTWKLTLTAPRALRMSASRTLHVRSQLRSQWDHGEHWIDEFSTQANQFSTCRACESRQTLPS